MFSGRCLPPDHGHHWRQAAGGQVQEHGEVGDLRSKDLKGGGMGMGWPPTGHDLQPKSGLQPGLYYFVVLSLCGVGCGQGV